MSKLFHALTTNDTLTENGMPTNSTSSNFVLDMFFKMGGSRGMQDRAIEIMFERAFSDNPLLAVRALFYNRDIRGGQGERRSFRVMFRWLSLNHPDVAKSLIQFVPEYGRWDDLFSAFGTRIETEVVDLMLSALKRGDKLCAKWMPRENKKHSDCAERLMYYWRISPKKYRKLLSGNTSVVENLMCSDNWGEINYNHVPSKASNVYRKAFWKHDSERYAAWIESLSKPESGNKIHASAIFPNDVIKSYLSSYGAVRLDKTVEAQWKALPNYLPEGRKMLAVCDVSGSMRGQPLEVCVSLGIYLAEKNVGPFKDGFITFSGRPQLQILKGSTVASKVEQLIRAQWDMNTNLEAVFRLILDRAVQFNLSEEDMPSDILILSDMQFDACISQPSDSAFEMIKRKYSEAGYNMPNVIFWNLRTSSGIPVKYDTRGTALVSGFSPSAVKNILGGTFNPMDIMLNTLNSDRYACITL